MARYHVKADGSMGVCTAKEGNCPFGGDAGTKHFTNKSEALAYSEKIAEQSAASRGALAKKGNGGKPPVPPSKGGVASSESGDNWPKYEGEFSKWNGVPADNHWKDVPGINNDPSEPSTKIRAYVMDKMAETGFGDGAKGNDFTHDGVGYLGQSTEVGVGYLGDHLDTYDAPDPSFDGGVGYKLPEIKGYDSNDENARITRPTGFGSITNPGDNYQYIGNSGDLFNKSYHGMSLSDDGKTLHVEECFNYDAPSDDYGNSNENVARSLEGRKLFRETMEAHGITGKSDGYGAVDYTIDATDPKAIDNYFEAYKDFKNKFGEENWKKGYYGME